MGRLARTCAASGLVAALVLGACSLNLDGYEGPPVAEDAPASSEAATDASSPVADAPSDVDAEASPSFCATLSPTPTFCDDFERTDTKGKWDMIGLSAGGTLSLAPGITGTELVATQPAFTHGTAGANINKFFGQTTRDVTFAFDLTVDAPPANGGVQIMSIFIQVNGDQNNQGAIYLVAQPSGLKVAGQTFPSSGMGEYGDVAIDPSVLTYGQRRRIVMHLTFGSAPHLVVTADGLTAYDDATYMFFGAGTSYFGAGIHYADPPSGPLTVHVDNVVIDLK